MMIRRMMMMISVPMPMYMDTSYPGVARLNAAPPPVVGSGLLAVLGEALRAVLGTRLAAPRHAPLHDLAGAVRVLRGRVLDAVAEVEERHVVAVPAVHRVLLAVAQESATPASALVRPTKSPLPECVKATPPDGLVDAPETPLPRCKLRRRA